MQGGESIQAGEFQPFATKAKLLPAAPSVALGSWVWVRVFLPSCQVQFLQSRWDQEASSPACCSPCFSLPLPGGFSPQASWGRAGRGHQRCPRVCCVVVPWQPGLFLKLLRPVNAS